ncbi:MAG: hypothetical protein WA982_04360 [Rubrobacteraceae bacterium]
MATEDRVSGSHYWLIVSRRAGAQEIFSLGLAELECLPVFSFSDEAEMFLELRGLENDWEPWKTGLGELFSMLFSNLSGIQRVSLDPLPEISDDNTMTDLVSISRKSFMDRLLVRGRSWWLEGKDQRDGKGQIAD